MIQTAIVDDDGQIREHLKEMLTAYGTEKHLDFHVDCFSSGASFLMSPQLTWQLVLMDVDMPILNGIETAKQMRQFNTTAVLLFITNLAQYAMEGYAVDATDYILKPVAYPAFAMKLNRAVERIERQKHSEICLKTADGMYFMDSADIYYIEVFHHELIYHTARGRFKVWGTLSKAEEELKDCQFARCNVCYLVNLQHVEALEGDDAVVHGERLKVSASRKKDFIVAIMHNMKGSR